MEIMKCKMADELPLVLGDMNAKIEKNGEQIIQSSANGRLLLDVINNHNLDILNFHETTKGKWTHVIRTTGASSVLDYIMTCHEITRCVNETTIDEDCLFCPFRIKKKKKQNEPQFSDHNAIIVKLQIQHEKRRSPAPSKWKLTKEGLESFHQLTTNGFDTDIPDGNIQDKYNIIEERIHSTMSKCFKKVKQKKEIRLRSSYLIKYKQITQFAKKGKAQRKVARLYIQEIIKMNTEEVAVTVKENVKNTLRSLSINNTFSPDNFWKLCKNSKKQSTNGTSVETLDGIELFGEETILSAYQDEFIHRLRRREITPELKNYEMRTEQICKLYIEEAKNQQEPQYTGKEFQLVRSNLKKGKSCGRDLFPPEIFIEGGEQLTHLILSMFNQMKSADEIPKKWTQVQITTIYKNKGKRKQLINHRGIFLKQVLSKMFEKINMNRIGASLEAIDKFQAGARPGRSTADQTFLLRAAIDHSKYLKRPLYLTVYDFAQCFDSLWLYDCLLSLWKLGVKSETLNIIKNLNEICSIVVKTPVGLTNEFEVKSIVQQGSVSGGALCAASTGEVTQEELGGGCQIGVANIKALTFVDDIAAVSTELQDTYTSHNNIVWFSKKKRLELSKSKCMIMCINGKTTNVLPRLKIGESVLSSVQKVTYLGDQFNTAGTNKDLVEERVKKGQSCIVNAISLCNEVTMGVYTIQTLLLLHKSLFLPVVLYNSQAWGKLAKQDLTSLKRIQSKYLKRIFHVPASTSNAITLLETGSLPIEQEIHTRQLNFLHHILTMNDSDPVRMVYQEQMKYEFENNWANEVQNIRHKYDIHEADADIAKLSKQRWKSLVKKTTRKYALDELNKVILEQKHAAKIGPYDALKHQAYLDKFSPSLARTIFQVRAGVLDIKAVRTYQYNDTSCRLCNDGDEDVVHVVNVCKIVARTRSIIDVYSNSEEDMREVAVRCIEFAAKVEELSKELSKEGALGVQ